MWLAGDCYHRDCRGGSMAPSRLGLQAGGQIRRDARLPRSNASSTAESNLGRRCTRLPAAWLALLFSLVWPAVGVADDVAAIEKLKALGCEVTAHGKPVQYHISADGGSDGNVVDLM